jgi:hypothetical protein
MSFSTLFVEFPCVARFLDSEAFVFEFLCGDLQHPEIFDFRMLLERIIKQQFSHNFKICQHLFSLQAIL